MKSLCLLLALSSSPSIPAPLPGPAARLSGAVQDADIQAEVDRALRWMRQRQNIESGSYGGVHETLQVLKAMATSPRAYRPSDGPYVAKALDFLLSQQTEDGSFKGNSPSPAETLTNTRCAVFLFELFAVHGAARDRALAFLGDAGRGASDPYGDKWELVADPSERKALLNKRVQALLAERKAADHWQDQRGALLATCASVLELNSLARISAALPKGDRGEKASIVALPSYESSLDAAALGRASEAMLRGAEYLIENAVATGRWGFQEQADPGITAMTTSALLSLPAPRPAAVQTAIDSAIEWLVGLQHEDGSIHAGQLPNYVTSAVLMALTRADREAYAGVIARARNFLVGLQADEGEGYSPSDRYYGGVGYGGDERPDLSNMNMALEALSDAGLEQGDATFQKALSFLQRCQNRSESNQLVLELDGALLVSGNDGGAGYAPGESKAGFITLRDGRKIPRSYGSMTYALLKGYLFAGLPKDDGRVEAAWSWLSANYTLDINPGFEGSSDPSAGYQGLFYYFTTMSKALDLYDQNLVTDAAGLQHDWRAELVGRVLSLQRQDGSWINSNAPRWFEGNPVLASSYALLTLANTLPGK